MIMNPLVLENEKIWEFLQETDHQYVCQVRVEAGSMLGKEIEQLKHCCVNLGRAWTRVVVVGMDRIRQVLQRDFEGRSNEP